MPNIFDEISTDSICRDGMSPEELARELDALGPRWSVVDGALHLAVQGPMSRTGPVAAFVGALADELDHYPSITVDRDGLSLSIRTYGTSSVTVEDLMFAAHVEQWLRGNGWAA